ncbi:MAG: tetratricopeptide repeat protein [Myxococcota bacterium]
MDRGSLAIQGRVAAATFAAGAALAVLAYAPSLRGPFVFDDLPHVARNAALRKPGDLVGVLFSGWQGTRPVYNLSLALDAGIFGVRPLPFRATNLALHLACGALVALLARRLGAASPAALLAASIFLLHPVHVESVAYVNSRSGILCTLLGLGALLVAARPGLGRLGGAAAALLAVACVGAKEVGAVLAPLAWLVVLPRAGAPRRRAWLLVPAALALPLIFAVFPSPHAGTIGASVPQAAAHLRAEPAAILSLARLLVWPVGQTVEHALPLPAGWFEPSFVLPALTVAAALALWAWAAARGRAPLLALAIGWFAVTIAPTNSIVPFADVLAERHLYFPSVGPIVAVAIALERVAARARPAIAVAGAVTLAFVLCTATARRSRVWADELDLWADATRVSPASARAHANLGAVLAERGRIDEALHELRVARTLDPSFADAWFNEGTALGSLGRHGEAVGALRRACAARPRDVECRLALADALARSGATDDALRLLDSLARLPIDAGRVAAGRAARLRQATGRATP